jgi:Tfp pilus tip-associated adhesin PilY1
MEKDGWTIWKFEFNVTDEFTLEMPGEPKFLTVQMQYQRPVLWAIVQANAPNKQHRFRIVGTGNPIPAEILGSLRYIATFQDSILVWHMFHLV